MKFSQLIFTVSMIFAAMSAQAKINVLFHPYDPTLETIAQAMSAATQEINIVMYNIDTTDSSPIIQKLKSVEMQKKIQSGEVKVRIIFEGYGTPAENQAKMKSLEDIGMDARFLGIDKKVHHKFAVIDPDQSNPKLITGSANWSMSSAKNYSENILFAEGEPELTAQFYQEFAFLWSQSQEYGQIKWSELTAPISNIAIKNLDSTQAYFNSTAFYGSKGKTSKFYLTKKLVAAIDQAEGEILIATTRFKLAPVFHAIQRAADRGVKIKIALSMDEYVNLFERRKPNMRNRVENCANMYDPKCSSGVNFAPLLAFNKFKNNANVELRIKFFSLNKEDYLQKQLHSKYIIIDRKKVLTGSFNWSYSSENSHVENIVALNEANQAAINQFLADFKKLWSLNREQYSQKLQEVSAIESQDMVCKFEPMTLTMTEIDRLLFPKKGVYSYKHCK